jgi:hypothetical protein
MSGYANVDEVTEYLAEPKLSGGPGWWSMDGISSDDMEHSLGTKISTLINKPVVTPDQMKAMVLGWFEDMRAQGLIGDGPLPRFDVEADPGDPNRLDIVWRPDLDGYRLHVAGTFDVEPEPEDTLPGHDNEADGLIKCEECKGTGTYTGLWSVEHCKTCDGSGWL